jgi:hypothetical protein
MNIVSRCQAKAVSQFENYIAYPVFIVYKYY